MRENGWPSVVIIKGGESQATTRRLCDDREVDMKSRLLLLVLIPVLLGLGPRLAWAADCCIEMDAYEGKAGSQQCSDGTQTWDCPLARAKYPVQRWCPGFGPLRCDQERPPVDVPVFWVDCGTADNRCPDGRNTGRTVPADNALCSGDCPRRHGTPQNLEQREQRLVEKQRKQQQRDLEKVVRKEERSRSQGESRPQ